MCRFGLSSVACLGQPVLCGGGALLPGPGWDQEHPPSGFAIQAKEKEESGCKDCKGLANCHNIMACVNPLLACSRLVSCCCVMHTGGSPTCVPFSPPRPWSVFSLPSSGGGALLPGPGWDQEHPPSGFAIQAKEKEESGCKDCKGLANCHNIMACVNPLLACSRLVSCCCVMHTGGSPTCVPFSPPRPWSVFSLPSSGGGALLPGPGWDQEHPPSGFAIQGKEKEESGCKDCKGFRGCLQSFLVLSQ